MKYCYEELAGMIDHALLHPTMTDTEITEGCRMARRYGVASVCVKPCSVRLAADLLAGGATRVGCVVGFPHGNSTIETKRFETAQACGDGATEIDMVINVGRALGGDWDYIEREIRAVVEEARLHQAKVKVIFETDYLTDEELKRQLCRVSERAGADWVKTSTGFGFVKGPDGHLVTRGATESDLRLMRETCSDAVQVKASGGVRDLDALIRVRELGCTRCGTSSTVAILDEYRRRELNGEEASVKGRIGQGGY